MGNSTNPNSCALAQAVPKIPNENSDISSATFHVTHLTSRRPASHRSYTSISAAQKPDSLTSKSSYAPNPNIYDFVTKVYQDHPINSQYENKEALE